MTPDLKKNKKRGSVYGIFFKIIPMVLILIFTGFLVVSNIRIQQMREKLISGIKNIGKEVKDLEEKNEKLKTEIAQAGTRELLEKAAREDFGLKAPGEEVIVISKEEKNSNSQSSENKTEERKFWDPRVWWEWLKNKF